MAYRERDENVPFQVSANPTPAAPPTNLLEAKHYLETAAHLDAVTQRDMISAVKIVGEVLQRPLDVIPTDPKLLRGLLEDARFARRKLKRRRWTNIRSLLARALREAGVDVRLRDQTPLTAAWNSMVAPLPERPCRVSIRPFARWCGSQGINPQDVTQADAERYLFMLENHDLRLGRRRAYCQFVRSWNRAGEYNPDWPILKLTIENRHNWYAEPLDTFSLSFQDDVTSLFREAQSVDLTLSTSRRRRICATTAQGQRARILAMASALVISGWPREHIRSIADLVTVNAARAILKFVIDGNSGSDSRLAFADAILLCTLAKHWVKVPEEQLAELQNLRQRLRPKSTGMTKKNRETLDAFDDDRMILRFLDLPDRLFAEHRSTSEHNRSARLALQIALAVKILTHAPVRVKNLSAIKIGENLIDIGRGCERRVMIHFDEEDVKNNVALDFELPSDTIKLLDHYLKHIRPRILRVPSEYLFPNMTGGPKSPGTFSKQIADLVQDTLGVRVTAHQFRHLVGYIYLRDNPGSIEVVRQLHGHKNIDTTIRFYAGMEKKQAIAHFDQFVLSKRERLRGYKSNQRSSKRNRK